MHHIASSVSDVKSDGPFYLLSLNAGTTEQVDHDPLTETDTNGYLAPDGLSLGVIGKIILYRGRERALQSRSNAHVKRRYPTLWVDVVLSATRKCPIKNYNSSSPQAYQKPIKPGTYRFSSKS